VLRAYLNYPNARISIHRDLGCARIGQGQKAGQRTITLRPDTLASVGLTRFGRQFPYAAG